MKLDNKVKKIIEILKLEPLEIEGGYFREIYRSREYISKEKTEQSLETGSKTGSDNRVICTSIIYLITRDSFPHLHRLPSVEIYNFLSGDPVTMLNISKNGKAGKTTLGSNFYNGELLQHIVPPDCWQGALLKDEGSFALLGTVVSPGFEYNDYESGLEYKNDLLNSFPDYAELLLKLF